VYGKDDTYEILNKVCLRTDQQRGYKINEIKKNLTNSVYGAEQIITRKSSPTNRETKQTTTQAKTSGDI
jgi:hypothetical protein